MGFLNEVAREERRDDENPSPVGPESETGASPHHDHLDHHDHHDHQQQQQQQQQHHHHDHHRSSARRHPLVDALGGTAERAVLLTDETLLAIDVGPDGLSGRIGLELLIQRGEPGWRTRMRNLLGLLVSEGLVTATQAQALDAVSMDPVCDDELDGTPRADRATGQRVAATVGPSRSGKGSRRTSDSNGGDSETDNVNDNDNVNNNDPDSGCPVHARTGERLVRYVNHIKLVYTRAAGWRAKAYLWLRRFNRVIGDGEG
jgi:hypothetical protein